VSFNVDDFEFNTQSGMWVNYTVSKQKGEQIKNKFNIPLEMCEYLEKYDNLLADCSANEGRFMKCFRIHKNSSRYYTKQPMGVHMLAKMTIKMATFLGLRNPTTYTGHAIRRSAANVLAEAGTSSAMLKKHFNWKNEQTALKYVDNTNSSKLVIANKMGLSGDLAETKSNKSTVATNDSSKNITFTNCHNIVFNF